MGNNKIQEILELNTDFYSQVQKQFAKTRQNVMNGWFPIVELMKIHFKAKKGVKVLDLGCGNGRFFVVLGKNLGSKISYLGVDNNDYFLAEGMLKYDYAKFKKLDIFNNLAQINETFDVVVGFGITHHIPNKVFRLNWFEQVGSLINANGLLAYSFWDLQNDTRIAKAEKAHDPEENDYYYGWGETEAKRYFHAYSDEEVKEIVDLYKKLGFDLLKTYSEDGKTSKLNNYYIFQKN